MDWIGLHVSWNALDWVSKYGLKSNSESSIRQPRMEAAVGSTTTQPPTPDCSAGPIPAASRVDDAPGRRSSRPEIKIHRGPPQRSAKLSRWRIDGVIAVRTLRQLSARTAIIPPFTTFTASAVPPRALWSTGCSSQTVGAPSSPRKACIYELSCKAVSHRILNGGAVLKSIWNCTVRCPVA